MSDGLHFARLATLVGKKNRVRFGTKRCTVASVGRKDGSRFVMATDKHGDVILGEPQDFEIIRKKPRPA